MVLHGIILNMKPSLSIILPIYNAASYLDSCIATLSRQGLSKDEYELVMVDDGSTDSSPSQCDSYAASLPNARVLHQANRGAGAARNAGMDAARGEYLYFFDVDDGLEDGALRTLLDRCKHDALDVLFFAGELEYASEEARRTSPQDEAYFERRQHPGIVSGECMFIQQQKDANFCAQPCMLMTRLTFVREAGVRFAEGIINEDNLYVLLATIRAHRADVDPHPYYRYIVREGSVTVSNTSGFKRFDAHFWLAREFQKEYFRASEAGKEELAHAIAPLVNWFRSIALESYLESEGDTPEPTANDPISLALYHDLYERIKREEQERKTLESRLAEVTAQLEETQASTTWKVGRALTALPRALKDARPQDKN